MSRETAAILGIIGLIAIAAGFWWAYMQGLWYGSFVLAAGVCLLVYGLTTPLPPD